MIQPWKSFRVRIAFLTTIGLSILLGAWSLSIYKILLNSRMNELDAELSIQSFRVARSVISLHRQTLDNIVEPDDSEDREPPVSDYLLLLMGRDDSIVYSHENLTNADQETLTGFLEKIPQLDPQRDRLPPRGERHGEQRGWTPPPDSGEFPGDPKPHEGPFPPDFPNPESFPGPRVGEGEVNPMTMRLSGENWRIIPIARMGQRYIVGVPLAPVYEQARTVLNAMFLLFPAMLVLSLLITWLVVSRALVPIRRMTLLASKVDINSLDKRLSADLVPSEFNTLLDVFNEMLARLEKSVNQAQRFSADAAHELKTPLTILRGQIEQEIDREEPGSLRQQKLSSLLDEVARLSRITERLLLLSYGDSGRLTLNRQKLNLRELLDEFCDDFLDETVSVAWEPEESEPVWIEADPDLIAKAFQNIIENAVKYNRPGGNMSIVLAERGGSLQVRVGNTGEPISRDMQPHIFERFFRAANARDRRIEGTGLGLSLVREILQLHGGRIELISSADDWTEFSISLPRSR